jgi:hypothetical protein
LVDAGGYKFSGYEKKPSSPIALRRTSNSGKGYGACRDADDMDVIERMNMPMGYRLSRGFSILRGDENERQPKRRGARK